MRFGLLALVLLFACGGEERLSNEAGGPPNDAGMADFSCALPLSLALGDYEGNAELSLTPDGRCEETRALAFGHSHAGSFIKGVEPWKLISSSEGELYPGSPDGMLLPAPQFQPLELVLEHDTGVTVLVGVEFAQEITVSSLSFQR